MSGGRIITRLLSWAGAASRQRANGAHWGQAAATCARLIHGWWTWRDSGCRGCGVARRCRYLSHFRSVHRGAYFAEIRTTTVRKLLPESWGFFCPVHTPDGSPCGLLNHFAAHTRVVTRDVEDPFRTQQSIKQVRVNGGGRGARTLCVRRSGQPAPCGGATGEPFSLA